MKTLEIILRTCDRTNVHVDWRVRYCNLPKNEIVIGCTKSLVNSIKQFKDTLIKLTVLDDHSTEETKEQIKEIIKPVNGIFVELLDTNDEYGMKIITIPKDTPGRV